MVWFGDGRSRICGLGARLGRGQAACDAEDLHGAAVVNKSLPFTDVLPVPEGPVSIPGKSGDLTIGFSRTGFNHPWRVAMLAALQAEGAGDPNIKLIVLDGNVDVAKQSNDVRDLLTRGVDAVLLSPVELAALVPAARAVMAADIPLIVMDRDVPTEKTLFIGQSNVTMGEGVAEKMAKNWRQRPSS